MKILKFKFYGTIAMLVLFVSSCQDLTEVNINPNGIDPSVAHPNLIMPTVLTNTAMNYLNLGFGNMSGVMQHTQKDSWSDDHNDYAWNEDSWAGYYGILRDNQFMYDKAVEDDLKFHQGVALVMKSFIFGQITDLWGDAPYTDALKSEQGKDYLEPAFDTQKTIYQGIFSDLEEASNIFSGSDFQEVNPEADVLYGGDAKMWEKFANSLALRYYMRVSDTDLASIAKEGIERISKLPLITSADEDAAIPYIGTNAGNSWPSNIPFANNSAYLRFNLCSVLVEKLIDLDDPRIDVFGNKVQIQIVISDDHAAEGPDVIIDGTRFITNAIFAERGYKLKVHGENPTADDLQNFTIVDTNASGYVGIPPSVGSEPNWYNLNPSPVQGGNNAFVSKLNSMYSQPKGDLLKMRMMSASEVHFILAEAANKGWAVGDQQTHYEAGITASFETWGADITGYLEGAAAYDGSLEQLMDQKWIASWTAATEAWYDWRRTGMPSIQAGPFARRENLPLRQFYGSDERNLNPENYNAAIKNLQPTADSGEDNNDSAWSKMWLIQ